MEIFGIMLNRSEAKQVTDNFTVQEFYLDCSEFDRRTGNKFENKLRFQVSNSRTLELNKVNRGDLVKVQFNPKGREYDKKDGSGKGFSQNLDVWKIEVVTPQPQPSSQAEPPTSSGHSQEDEDDDLPF